MDAPDPTLATHLIRVEVPDPEGQARDGTIDQAVGPPAHYIGVVEQGGEVEVETDTARVISDGGFTLTVFAVPDPGIASQAILSWSKLPPGLALPAPGSPGTVTPPAGWSPEKVGYAVADASALDVGCWSVDARSRD